ncbi:uncharacterized protein [Typha latifolia]|uniref:uncharacterized protein isoform X3 n=1 Tax=Typha latifolia TaxID=4733 RepID=UPI003C2EFD0B
MGFSAMGSENMEEEGRLRTLVFQLQTEAGVLDRIVYKNKNQHRRCPYFQFLLKVRRDLRLLQSARLSEILNALLPIVEGRRPAQRALLPIRPKRKGPSVRRTYQERLLGVARILSQILLDVVSLFNKVSALSQTKHSVKLTEEGIEAFREYFPSSSDGLILECVWQEDKFVLLERTEHNCNKNEDEDQKARPSEASVQYETVELFDKDQFMDNDLSFENILMSFPAESSTLAIKPDSASFTDQTIAKNDDKNNADGNKMHLANQTFPNIAAKDTFTTSIDVPSSTKYPEILPEPRKKVAFVSVRPSMSPSIPNKKLKLDMISSNAAETEDPFSSLVAGTNDNSFF